MNSDLQEPGILRFPAELTTSPVKTNQLLSILCSITLHQASHHIISIRADRTCVYLSEEISCTWTIPEEDPANQYLIRSLLSKVHFPASALDMKWLSSERHHIVTDQPWKPVKYALTAGHRQRSSPPYLNRIIQHIHSDLPPHFPPHLG